LREFENRVLKRIFGSLRKEVIRSWKKLRIQFWLESLKRRDHSEDLSLVGRIILKWIWMEIGRESVGWIHLAQDRV
jgi:hypothetical protein